MILLTEDMLHQVYSLDFTLLKQDEILFKDPNLQSSCQAGFDCRSVVTCIVRNMSLGNGAVFACVTSSFKTPSMKCQTAIISLLLYISGEFFRYVS